MLNSEVVKFVLMKVEPTLYFFSLLSDTIFIPSVKSFRDV